MASSCPHACHAGPKSRYEVPQLGEKDDCPIFYPAGYQPGVTLAQCLQSLPTLDRKQRFSNQNVGRLIEATEKCDIAVAQSVFCMLVHLHVCACLLVSVSIELWFNSIVFTLSNTPHSSLRSMYPSVGVVAVRISTNAQ